MNYGNPIIQEFHLGNLLDSLPYPQYADRAGDRPFLCHLLSLDYSRNERKKSPLPMWERVGERGIIKRFPPPFNPLPPGEGATFWDNL
jgi:hypothetical protein